MGQPSQNPIEPALQLHPGKADTRWHRVARQSGFFTVSGSVCRLQTNRTGTNPSGGAGHATRGFVSRWLARFHLDVAIP
jgi:hypothetical protein